MPAVPSLDEERGNPTRQKRSDNYPTLHPHPHETGQLGSRMSTLTRGSQTPGSSTGVVPEKTE